MTLLDNQLFCDVIVSPLFEQSACNFDYWRSSFLEPLSYTAYDSHLQLLDLVSVQATLEEENRQTKADLISVSTERNATFLQLESLQHHASEPSAPDSTDAEKKLGVDGKMGILKLDLEKIADLETEVKRLKKV